MKKTKAILSKSRANDLIKMGNELLKAEISIKYPNRIAFIFNVTDKLMTDIDELANRYKK